MISEIISIATLVYILVLLLKQKPEQTYTPAPESLSDKDSIINAESEAGIAEVQSKALDTSPRLYFGLTARDCYSAILIIAFTNFLDCISKFDHSQAEIRSNGLRAGLLIYYGLKFMLVCCILAKAYTDLQGCLLSLSLSKLDFFSIHNGLGYVAIKEIITELQSFPCESVAIKQSDKIEVARSVHLKLPPL